MKLAVSLLAFISFLMVPSIGKSQPITGDMGVELGESILPHVKRENGGGVLSDEIVTINGETYRYFVLEVEEAKRLSESDKIDYVNIIGIHEDWETIHFVVSIKLRRLSPCQPDNRHEMISTLAEERGDRHKVVGDNNLAGSSAKGWSVFTDEENVLIIECTPGGFEMKYYAPKAQDEQLVDRYK